MGKKLKSFLQVFISLALGFFLIWYIYKDLTEDDKANIVKSFEEADYIWLLLSVSIATLSHIFRAYRWKYPLESLGLHIDMPNRFAAVMIGYIANLAFPRLGEVTRCGVVARYKKMPFSKIFGTVIAERFVDLVVLFVLIVLAILLQLDILGDFMLEKVEPILEKTNTLILLAVGGILGIVGAFIGWKFLQKSVHPVALKFREKVAGLWEGISALKNMEGQFGFYLHTVLIWASYVAMYYVTFNIFPETQEVPIGGVLASFVLGGLSIVAVQGGLGAYPLAVMFILALYGVDENRGYAFGWIMWAAQTVLILVLGFLSMIAMPLLNVKNTETTVTDVNS